MKGLFNCDSLCHGLFAAYEEILVGAIATAVCFVCFFVCFFAKT